MVLSHSRYLFAELVGDQSSATWLRCHMRAFAFFEGVPGRVVPDNLKAAVVRHAYGQWEANRAYRELAEHYDFLIDPNPPRQPHLKGKVERGVDFVKGNFLAGREPAFLDDLNSDLRGWCDEVSDRVHGTTRHRPYQVWKDEELKWLGVLPKVPFDLPTYKSAGLGRDCHLQFEQSYYSAPFRLVGSRLLVRAGLSDLRIYLPDNHELVATHARARAAGERHTHPDHLPAEKLPGLTLNRADCLSQATGIGPATRQVVAGLLDHRPEDYLRMAGRLLKLAKKVGPDRLEQACARSLLFDEPEYLTVRRILDKGLEGQAVLDLPQPAPKGQILRFARPATEYALATPQAGGAP